ncbi:MAG TPA: SDR family oxidoreductase [Pseudorhodoplanes sp.]|jgi:nucleoside-diphosphate-sugar epimerase|nr:SDR family oxidoreductase [Pseudorhodoplanes sp.]
MPASKTALVVGATGATSKRLMETLTADSDWAVIGLSRNPPASSARVTFIAADLSEAQSCRQALKDRGEITHIFYTARARHGEVAIESVEDNTAMLRNVLDAVEPVARGLRHVNFVQGGKYYGQHLGPFPTPAREDDPRHMPPNFYFSQQDLLVERQKGKSWTWSAARPDFVCDFSPGRGRNIVSIVGTYAAISRELGLPLDFPGAPGCYDTLKQATDATQLARAMVHVATHPACANKAFNVTNGDVFRWKYLWPKIAEFYGMKAGEPRRLKLAEWMADKEPVWERIVRRHGLKPQKLSDVAVWGYADSQLAQDYDVITSTTRLRQAGFHDVIDTEEMFIRHLTSYRDAKILP